jgi:hypothetical protein
MLARVIRRPRLQCIKDCDLVIEAVFEDRKVKAEPDRQGAAVIRPARSSPPTPRPCRSPRWPRCRRTSKRFVGIHFFSPVEKMMLVEIIKGKNTGDKALAVALDYVRRSRRRRSWSTTAAVSIANRALSGVTSREGTRCSEGVPPAMVENVGKMAGMPVGPLSLNDEVAVDWRGRFSRPPRPISARNADRSESRRRCWSRWWRSASALAARTARASTTIRRRARARRNCGRASEIVGEPRISIRYAMSRS